MNDNEAVFIGGVCDGLIRPASDPHVVGRRTVPVCAFGITDPDARAEFETSHYRLEVVRSGERRFHLYIEYGMSHEQAMQRLLERYTRAA